MHNNMTNQVLLGMSAIAKKAIAIARVMLSLSPIWQGNECVGLCGWPRSNLHNGLTGLKD
jgi:hypothetical protein